MLYRAFSILVFCLVFQPITTAAPASTVTAEHDATVATDWFELQLLLVQESPGFSPPVAARAFGYAGITLYEAVVPGMPEYQSLAGQLTDLAALPQPVMGESYHWPAVANTALAQIMRHLFPNAPEPYLNRVSELEQQFRESFSASVAPETLARSETHGLALAEAIYAWSLTDGGHEGFRRNFQQDYVPPSGPGLWEPTPRAGGEPFPAMQPRWGENRPFILSSGAECIPPAPEYSEDPESDFYRQALEVYQTVKEVTPEQREIALFWSDEGGATATPAGHWFSILTSIIKEQDLSLAFAAEAYAKLGMATSDAFIASWYTKYQYNLLRPITYIQRFIDASWNDPFVTDPLATPPFPEYTSGHSVQTAAAAYMMTELLGDDFAFTDDTHRSRGFAPRTYDSFWEAAEEAAISRLYGGVHFRDAIEHGLTQGKCVAQRVSTLQFRTQ